MTPTPSRSRARAGRARKTGGPKIRAVLFDLGGTLIDERDFAGWTELARGIYLDLDADALGRLDAIFPGPGGAAPEAYAW